ncbi:Zinc finger MSN2 [Fusarium albosuccineum]|uniref:Zinc finger MSN2 n=1 Tax=Fusarium albosuccineum TaxID=1237068 RepID=A0A8H4P2E8_9HYPO|nr:Zinc finger MSN2 [Fusarium albosuccineum]
MDDLEWDSMLSIEELVDMTFGASDDTSNDMPMDPTSHANDAVFADAHFGAHRNGGSTNAYLSDPSLFDYNCNFNFNNPLTLQPDYFDNISAWWDPTVAPAVSEYPNIFPNYTSSNTPSTESFDFSSTYSTSPMSSNYSPGEPMLSHSLGPTPEPTPATEPTKVASRSRRRAKAKPGSRPCDLKREQRKIDKPEKCQFCDKGHQWQRDLDRHYETMTDSGDPRCEADATDLRNSRYKNPSPLLLPGENRVCGWKGMDQADSKNVANGKRKGSPVMRARNVSHYTIPDVMLALDAGVANYVEQGVMRRPARIATVGT